jgi:hypothetical protein
MISVEVLELRIGLFYFGVTFALLLLAEKVAFLRIFVAGFFGTESSARLCPAFLLQLIIRLFQYNVDCPSIEIIYGQYSDFGRFFCFG